MVREAHVVSSRVHPMWFANAFNEFCRVFMIWFGITVWVWYASSFAVNSQTDICEVFQLVYAQLEKGCDKACTVQGSG